MDEPRIIHKRLYLRRLKEGTTAIDRRMSFVIGKASPAQRARLRGDVLEVATEFDALDLFRDLRKLAVEARAAGKEKQFLDGLDGRYGGQPEPEGGPSFKEVAQDWFETCVEGQDHTEGEVEATRCILRNHLVPFFGKTRIAAIGMREVDRFKAKKKRQEQQFGRGYSWKTINNMLSVLHRVMETAVEWELLERLPLTKRMWMKRDTADESQNWLSGEEEALLVGWIEEHWWEEPGVWLALLVQLVAGLRFSEVRALRRGDVVEVPQPGIWIRRSQPRKEVSTPKNKRVRFQPLPQDLVRRLRDRGAADGGGLLFVGVRGGVLANNTLNRWLRRACREVGIREVSSHGLRHTAGTSYAAQGHSQQSIGALLGHRSLKSTERYTHTADRLKGQAVDERWALITKRMEASRT